MKSPLLLEEKIGTLLREKGMKLTLAESCTGGLIGHRVTNIAGSSDYYLGSLTAYARIDNLTDERYVGSVIVNQALSQFYEPAPGRNWTLGLRLVLPL